MGDTKKWVMTMDEKQQKIADVLHALGLDEELVDYMTNVQKRKQK